MNDEIDDLAAKRALAYPRLVTALRLTTAALERARTAGAEYRVEENKRLLRELGEPVMRPDE